MLIRTRAGVVPASREAREANIFASGCFREVGRAEEVSKGRQFQGEEHVNRPTCVLALERCCIRSGRDLGSAEAGGGPSYDTIVSSPRHRRR
jgi:hypothetical protein